MLPTLEYLKENHTKIHYFGLGFIQIKIDDNLRYHFYHPGLTAFVGDEEIHSHRYDFISTILAGSLTQQKYDLYVDGSPTTHVVSQESCSPEKHGGTTTWNTTAYKGRCDTFTAGQSYTILSKEYHTVKADFAITKLYRGTISTPFANVVRPRFGPEPVCPFSSTMTENECWSYVEDCLKIATQK